MQRSEKTEELIAYLREVPVGETVGFQQMAEDCEWSRKKQFHLLQSAIKSLAYEGIVFQSVRGIGYIRLDPNKGIYRVREWHGGQMKNSTKRMSYKVNGTNPDNLDETGKRDLHQARAEVAARQTLVEHSDLQKRKKEYLAAKAEDARKQEELKKAQREETLRWLIKRK